LILPPLERQKANIISLVMKEATKTSRQQQQQQQKAWCI